MNSSFTFLSSLRPRGGLCVFVLAAAAVFFGLAPKANAQIYVLYNYNSTNGMIGEYNFDGSVINATLVSGISYGSCITVSGGLIYVASNVGNSVSVYNASTGALVNAALITGLNQPRGIAVSGGEIFVANYAGSGGPGAGTVGAYNLNGTAVNTRLITGLTDPIGITVSGGNIYINNDYESDIAVYTTGGSLVNFTLIPGNPLYAYYSAIIGNQLFVANYSPNNLESYNASTGATINAAMDPGAGGIGGFGAVDIVAAGGELFTINQNGVGEYNPDGTVVNAALITGLSGAQSVAVVPPNLVVSLSVFDDQIGEYGLDGTTVNAALISGFPALSSPEGIVGSGSNFYVADLNSAFSSVKEFTGAGAVVSSPLVSALNYATAVALSGNTLYVAYLTGMNSPVIGEYNATTGAVINAQLITGLPTVVGMTISGGELYIVSGVDGTVGEYNLNGSVVSTSLIPASHTWTCIAVSGNTIYVGDATLGTIGAYTTAGTPINASLITLPFEPNSIVTFGEYLFVGMGDQIGEYTMAGATVNAALVTGLTDITGLGLVDAVTSAPSQTTPTLTWATPSAITYGTALSGAQLDAGASTAGTFVYSPLAGTVLGAGSQTLNVTFTPTDTINYTTATGSVTLTVNKATPTVTWAAPAGVATGTQLSSAQLDATASVAGTFNYTPALGTVLTAGSQALSVTFTPSDTTDYNSVTASTTLAVGPAIPTISWSAPLPITYGTPLGSAQLDAVAYQPGTFSYSPALGTVLNAGVQTLTVTFTPTDTTDFGTATSSVTIQVQTAAASVTLGNLSQTYSGSPESVTATTSPTGLPVSITYNGSATPPVGAGTYSIAARITNANYQGSATGTLTIAKAAPVITWGPPAAITAPTALSSAQLDATASVPGTFSYSPAAGAVLPVGNQKLSVTFTPGDLADYATATGTVTLAVNAPGAAAYFGTIGGVAGSTAAASDQRVGAEASSAGSAIAASLNPTQTGGTMIGFIASANEGFATSFTLAANGSFTAVTQALVAGSSAGQTLTISGQVSGGVLSGTIAPLSLPFSATVDPSSGATVGIAGAYQAAAVDSSGGSTYSIVGTQGDVFVLAVTPTLVTGGTGTATAGGAISVQTAQGATITGAVNAATTNISGTLSVSGGAAVPFAGLSSATTPTNRLANLSTRGQVTSGQNILVAGFVVAGSAPETLLLRAVGPGLTPFGVTGVLANPSLQLFGANGSLIASDTGWGGGASLTSTFAQVGAFPLASTSADSALVSTLTPGAYTIQVTNAGSGSGGTALAEIYEVNPSTQNALPRLVNLSGRGQVTAGTGVLTSGFYIGGNDPEQLLVRGIGPTLAQFGITGALATPLLSIYDANGNLVAQNQSWGTPISVGGQTAGSAAAIAAASAGAGAFALPAGSSDSAILVTLAPGAYTAQLSGANGATGVGLIELYELAAP